MPRKTATKAAPVQPMKASKPQKPATKAKGKGK